jgi:hypothetical protein
MLTHLLIPTNTNDQPIDLMSDIDEYVCDFNISEAEVLETLDDAIIQSYRAIWS